MAAKLQLLVAVALGLSAFALNDSNGNKAKLNDLEKLLWKLAPETNEAGDFGASMKKTMLRVVQPHGGSAASLEKEVTDLVMSKAQAAFGKTPFGETVKKIVDLINEEMLPEALKAHKADQEELNSLSAALTQCGETKLNMVAIAEKSKTKYLKFSPLHKTCRTGQAGLMTSKHEACQTKEDKRKFMNLKYQAYQLIDAKLKDQQANKQIMQKEASESTESYLNRVADTVCGSGDDTPGSCAKAACGTPQCGFRCQFQCAKKAYEDASDDHDVWTEKCNKITKQFDEKLVECDNLQDQMDAGACKRAVDMKDACETYAECYTSKKLAYDEAEKVVKKDEADRQAEWTGLKKMQCIMNAFSDGELLDDERKKCHDMNVTVDAVSLIYPTLHVMEDCEVPKLYPTTGEYKKEEFAPLPALAKGKEDAYECTGVLEIRTTPATGSPASCKCERITLNGPYSPGPMVKCTDCLDIRKSTDTSSCPDGTKLFAPRTREDWKTFLSSAEALRNPNWVVDITRPQVGCGGCSKSAMNSGMDAQASWVTKDSSPWWLRSTSVDFGSDYHANCYLDLWPSSAPLAGEEDKVTFKASSCDFHSKSYYCQLESVAVVPKPGSPQGCRCKKVELTGHYSPGALIKCMGCLDVSKTTQKNSCPKGTKIFAPKTREDWKVFIDSATPVRAPSWIVDVTRPANGCGGCSEAAMNSDNLAQKTWRTADGAAWWLRSTSYTEPSGDYEANCYMDLWHMPENENSVGFNDMGCTAHADSYYCQSVKKPPPPPPAPAPPPPSPPPTSPAAASPAAA